MKIISYLKKDWPIIPIIVFLMAGYLCPFLDFIPGEKSVFPPPWWTVIGGILIVVGGILIVVGGILIVVGGIIELMVRKELVEKAQFPNFYSTKILQTVKEHRLITDGMFRYVRHPLYVGRILLSFGWVLLFSSLYGVLLMAIGALFFLPRIRIEEEMLIEEFGDAYRDYQKTTKKLIPFLY